MVRVMRETEQCNTFTHGWNYVALARMATYAGSLAYVPQADALSEGKTIEDLLAEPEAVVRVYDKDALATNQPCDPCADQQVGAYVEVAASELAGEAAAAQDWGFIPQSATSTVDSTLNAGAAVNVGGASMSVTYDADSPAIGVLSFAGTVQLELPAAPAAGPGNMNLYLSIATFTIGGVDVSGSVLPTWGQINHSWGDAWALAVPFTIPIKSSTGFSDIHPTPVAPGDAVVLDFDLLTDSEGAATGLTYSAKVEAHLRIDPVNVP